MADIGFNLIEVIMKKVGMVLLMGLVSWGAWADEMDDLERILGTEADVKITLGAGMLGIAKMFTKDDKEAQAVLSGLKDLSINVYELSDAVYVVDVSDWMADNVKRLAKNGVHEIVRVVEGDERVHILAKVDGTLLSELSIMVFEAGDEFVYIKMDGDIDVAKIREVTGSFDVNINGLDALSMNL